MSAGLTDTEPLPDPEPAPDPAPPPPTPKPKPAPKRAQAPVHQAPAPTYKRPARSYSPTYAPTRPLPRAYPKGVTHGRKHARKRPKHVAPQPKQEHRVKGAAVEQIQLPPASVLASTQDDPLRRGLVIAGLGLATLLFLLVVAVPATPARSTPPGRLVGDHQTELVLAGVAMLLLTVLLFAVTGNAA